MSTTQVTTLDNRLAKIAEKSGKPLEEIKVAYNEALKIVPVSMKSDRRKQEFAIATVNKNFLINTKSDAIKYEGVIMGAERTKDINELKWNTALKAYEDNPQSALDNGIVKVEGEKIIALDTRKEVRGKPNDKFGKPLKEHLYNRKLYIVARKPGDEKWTRGTMTLWNEQAKLTIPVLKSITFLANGEIKDGTADLRSSVDTQFEIQQTQLSNEALVSIIDELYEDEWKTLAECWEFHNSLRNPDNPEKMKPEFWDSLVVTEGQVTWIQEFDKSIKLTLKHDTIAELPFHERGVTVWLPKSMKSLINFGRNTVVTVIGRTSDENYYDSEKQMQTSDKKLALNAFAVIGRPGLIVEKSEEGESI